MVAIEFEGVHLLGKYLIKLNKKTKESFEHNIYKGVTLIASIIEEGDSIEVIKVAKADFSDIQEIYDEVVNTNQPIASHFKEIKEQYGLLGVLFSIYIDIKTVQVANSDNPNSNSYIGKVDAGMALERTSPSLSIKTSNTTAIAIVSSDVSDEQFPQFREDIVGLLQEQSSDVVALFLYDTEKLVEDFGGYKSFTKEFILGVYMFNGYLVNQS